MAGTAVLFLCSLLGLTGTSSMQANPTQTTTIETTAAQTTTILTTTPVIDHCTDPWNVTVTKDLQVHWEGIQREATVIVDIKAVAPPEDDCLKKLSFSISFKDETPPLPKTPCPNTVYEIDITLRCQVQDVETVKRKVWTEPDAPSNVKATDVKTTSFRVAWHPPFGPIKKFRVKVNSSVSETDDTFLIIEGLEPETQYTVSVSARNENDWSQWSEVILVETKKIELPTPQDFEIVNLTDTTVQVKWLEVEFEDYSISYGVQWRLATESNFKGRILNSTTCKIKRLLPYRNYVFRVRALANKTFGNWSEVLKVRTLAGVPFEPRDLTRGKIDSISIQVKWKEPMPFTGPIRFYSIQWAALDSFASGEDNTTDLSYTIQHLIPLTDYQISVSATTDGGTGNWTTAIEIQTESPVPPEKVHTTDVTSFTITVSWREPQIYKSREIIIGYGVRWGKESDSNGITQNITELSYVIENLEPFERYSIQVRSWTEKGSSSWTNPIITQTNIGVPFPPINVREGEVANTSIEIKWDVSPLYKKLVENHSVKWGKTGERETTIKNTTALSYVIGDLEPFNNYSIYVKSWTVEGAGNWSDELIVQTIIGVPLAPRNVTISQSGTNSLEISWKEPYPSRGEIVSYSIQWSEKDSKLFQTNVTNGKKFIVRNLSPFTWYIIRVLATTKAGDGEWSTPVEGRTAIGIPTTPRNFKEKNSTNTTIEVKWEKPNPTNGPIVNYTLKWTNLNNNNTNHGVTTGRSYLIKNLNPFTNHSIQVRAATEAGFGKWTEELIIRTDTGVPSQPKDVTVKTVRDTSIHLTWKEPEPIVGNIIHYVVQWIDIISNKSLEEKVDNLQYVISGLLPYRKYIIKICAVTEAGSGNPSAPFEIRTRSGVPSAPRNIIALNTTSITICIKWDEPSPFRGPILSYIVRWNYAVSHENGSIKTNESSACIQNLKPYTFYDIDVKADTEAGFGPWSDAKKIQTGIGIPTRIQNLEMKTKTAWSIHLSWLPPDPPNGPLLNYKVQWGINGNFAMSNLTEDTSFATEDLIPYTNYSFRVSASTKAGFGPFSEPVIILTDIAKPTAPIDLTLASATNISLAFKWKKPIAPNGPILGYKGKWKKTFDISVNGEFEVQSLEHKIHELDPFTSYSVQISARTEAGFGSWTDLLETSTQIGVPKPALLQSVKADGSRSIVVEWTAQNPYPGPTNYSLEVWRKSNRCDNGIQDSRYKTIEGPKGLGEWKFTQHAPVEGLIPYTDYYVRILLKTVVDQSESANSTIVSTLSDKPEAPRQIEADCKLSTETAVRWKKPFRPNGKIKEYLVRYGVEYSVFNEKAVPVEDECQENHHIRIVGLSPEKQYKIYVRAKAENVEENGEEASLKEYCILPAGVPPVSNVNSLKIHGSGPYTLMLELSQDVFSDAMGELVNYAVLIGVSEAVGNATSGHIKEMFPTWANFSDGSSFFFQATPLEWNPFVEEKDDPLKCEKVESESSSIYRCKLGVDNECSYDDFYCNGPLRPGTNYGVKLRAFTKGGFSETEPLFAYTDPIRETSSIVGIVVGVVFVLLLVSVFIAGTVFLKRKGKLVEIRIAIQSRFNPSPSAPPPNVTQVLQLEECSSLRPLDVQNFVEYLRLMMSDSHLRFSQEFEVLKKKSPKYPCSTAEMEENRPKNRWVNIFPYDHSRVKLLPLCDEPGSDFVNANYIPGYSSQREYIASQGPLANTVDDFWRMIWEQSTSMIVMLTQCVERGKNKCEQYWPDAGEAKHYGDMQVRNISESMLSSYIIRLFHVQLGSQERRVKQMHFTQWPDFGCPESPDDLINFVRAARDHLSRFKPGPILVHCSAGVGRTGTFIAVDRLSQQLRYSSTIDIFDTVMQLRHHRVNMVQTEDQYIYIHLCVRQLIEEVNEPKNDNQESEYEEAIYSNVGMEKDTGL